MANNKFTEQVYDTMIEFLKDTEFQISGNLEKDICKDICLVALVKKCNKENPSMEFRELIKETYKETAYACIVVDDLKTYEETCSELSLPQLYRKLTVTS